MTRVYIQGECSAMRPTFKCSVNPVTSPNDAFPHSRAFILELYCRRSHALSMENFKNITTVQEFEKELNELNLKTACEVGMISEEQALTLWNDIMGGLFQNNEDE